MLIEFKIQPFKETHGTCGQMLFMEKDTSSKSAPSNSSITMTSIKEEVERDREEGRGRKASKQEKEIYFS